MTTLPPHPASTCCTRLVRSGPVHDSPLLLSLCISSLFNSSPVTQHPHDFYFSLRPRIVTRTTSPGRPRNQPLSEPASSLQRLQPRTLTITNSPGRFASPHAPEPQLLAVVHELTRYNAHLSGRLGPRPLAARRAATCTTLAATDEQARQRRTAWASTTVRGEPAGRALRGPYTRQSGRSSEDARKPKRVAHAGSVRPH